MGRQGVWLIALAFLCCHEMLAKASSIAIQSVNLSAPQVGLYQPLTISFSLSKTYTNPYDPDIVDARFEFVGPSGTIRVIPAYWTDGTPSWRAKIVPLETGVHLCRILVNDSVGDSGVSPVSFTAIASSDKGFVHIDARNGRYLRYDRGDAYLPVGHDVCWFGNDGNFNAWMTNMGQAGENWTRFWIVSHANQDIEWGGGTSYQLGRYSQANAQLIDNMLEAVRTRGICVQMCLDSFNGWNLTLFSNWSENPYNTANGGMCAKPNDYFVNSSAKRYARNRFRYIVARWAWNPAILCWEFFNEVDAIGGNGATFWGHETEVASWHQEMAQYIRSIDPFGHLRTTSFADGGPRPSYDLFWQLPEMDIVQCHRYSILFPSEQVNLIRSVQHFNKPVIMGETAANSTDPSQLDANGQSLHDTIWAAALIESGAMSWWWDSWIHPKNLYYRFKPLVAFLAAEDWAPQQLAELNYTTLAGPSTPEIYGSGGPHSAYLYIRNWQGPVSGMRIRFNQLTTLASYKIEYWDTNTQSSFLTQTVSGSVGGLVLDLPNFARDLAIKIKAQGPQLQVTPLNLTATAYLPRDVSLGSLAVTNVGSGTCNYTITPNIGWLTVSPSSGSVTAETDTIGVSLLGYNLVPGPLNAVLTVSDNDGVSPPVNVVINVTALALPGDFDLDGDVDQTDFGQLQACLKDLGTPPSSTCKSMDLSGDTWVGQADVVIFQKCMAGADVIVEPGCAQ